MLRGPAAEESSHAKDQGGRRFRPRRFGPGDGCLLKRSYEWALGGSEELGRVRTIELCADHNYFNGAPHIRSFDYFHNRATDDHDVLAAHHDHCADDHPPKDPSPQDAQARRPAPLPPGTGREECRPAGRQRRVHPHRDRLLLGASAVRTVHSGGNLRFRQAHLGRFNDLVAVGDLTKGLRSGGSMQLRGLSRPGFDPTIHECLGSRRDRPA